ncbi:hypothetical protein [Xylocopilactobacillus apis]|uniref:hypothetical protein n=1 Tax=Xylocopilactobacillus apis TaxID=2932183 RepID=UPI0029540BD2|nr:hypothetical protein [Xylocopilactobacillus apis]
MNKIKSVNRLILIVCSEILTIFGSAFFLSRNFSIKLNLNFFLVLLWLIILFSSNQIKGQKQNNKILRVAGWILTIIIVILMMSKKAFYFSLLTIITSILVTVKTTSNEQLNRLSSQIGLWIFGLLEIIYSLIGFLSLLIVFKVIVVFISGIFFKNFLEKRKFVNYVILIVIGIIVIFVFDKHYLYLILQILIPLVPRFDQKKEPYQLIRLSYRLLSFLTI